VSAPNHAASIPPSPGAGESSEKTRRLAAKLRVVGWLYVGLVVVQHFLIRPFTIPGIDFPKHWLAPVAILEGRNNYVGEELWLFYNYPQWSALVTFWLGWLSRPAAEVVWKAMNVGFVVLAWWLAWRHFRPPMPAGVDDRIDLEADSGGGAPGVAADFRGDFCGFRSGGEAGAVHGEYRSVEPAGDDGVGGGAAAGAGAAGGGVLGDVVPDQDGAGGSDPAGADVATVGQILYGWVLFMGSYLLVLLATGRVGMNGIS
jgi:hypothetical protein